MQYKISKKTPISADSCGVIYKSLKIVKFSKLRMVLVGFTWVYHIIYKRKGMSHSAGMRRVMLGIGPELLAMGQFAGNRMEKSIHRTVMVPAKKVKIDRVMY